MVNATGYILSPQVGTFPNAQRFFWWLSLRKDEMLVLVASYLWRLQKSPRWLESIQKHLKGFIPAWSDFSSLCGNSSPAWVWPRYSTTKGTQTDPRVGKSSSSQAAVFKRYLLGEEWHGCGTGKEAVKTGRSWKLLPAQEETASTPAIQKGAPPGLSVVKVCAAPILSSIFLSITLFGFLQHLWKCYRSAVLYLKPLGPDILDFWIYQNFHKGYNAVMYVMK